MQYTEKKCARITIVFLTLSLIIAVVPLATAASNITLNPAAQAPGNPVTVEGTGFGASRAAGIGIGTEQTVINQATPTPTGSGAGPWTSYVANPPVKPGTFRLYADVDGVTSEFWDNGDGTLSSSSTYFVSGTINYATGQFSRTSTSDLSSYTIVHTVNYTRYEHKATPTAGVNTTASGTFSASISVPSVANGNYTVTVVDSKGTLATAVLRVDATIPEGISIAVVALLSSLALIVSFRFLRKKPDTQNYGSMKLIK